MVGTKKAVLLFISKTKTVSVFQELLALMFSWFIFNASSVVITVIPLNDQTTVRIGIYGQCRDEKHLSVLLHSLHLSRI